MIHSIIQQTTIVPAAKLDLRPAQAADAPQVISVINAVCQEKVHLLTEQFSPTPQWQNVLYYPEKTPKCLLVVPLVDEQIVGWCRVFSGTNLKTQHVADIGLGLLAPYRRQGIGSALLQYAIHWATQQGFVKLTADCFSNNQAARAFFKYLDFQETGIRMKQYIINRQPVDQILLERFLP